MRPVRHSMDSTLQALGQILLKAVPTLVLLVVLNIYMKAMFFKPLKAVLEKRRQQTEGAREAAEASLKRASDKTAEYEKKLQEARTAIYKEQEDMRRRWIEEQTAMIDNARSETHHIVRQAREEIDGEIAGAKQQLAATSDALADRIADNLLARRPS